jgi:hypothetical protein
MMAAPSPGLTVDSLAAQNLVEGIPGYYPTEVPNIYTAFNGTTWTPPSGGTDALAQGRGFVWYFYDETFNPGGPSTSVALPMTVEAPVDVTEPPASVQVQLHAVGSGMNLVGNPFRRSLDVSDIASWATGGSLASAVGQVWDAPDATFHLTSALAPRAIGAWQGMLIENDDAAGLSIPASAQTDGGIFQGIDGDNRRLLALEVSGTDGTSGAQLLDRAVALQFSDGAVDGWDIQDASKLTPFATNYVLLGIEGERDGGPVLKAQESRRFNPQAPFELVLDFQAVGTGTSFVIRWPQMLNFPEDWGFELMDLATLASADLRVDTQFVFTAIPTPPVAAGGAAIPATAVHAGADARFVLRVTPGTPTSTTPVAPPPVFAFAPPAPNPTSGEALLRFELPRAEEVALEVFDIVGRRVATLVDQRLEAGRHTARLDAGRLAAGLYVVRLSAGDFVASHRVVVAASR